MKFIENPIPMKYKILWNTETEMECQYIDGFGVRQNFIYMKPYMWN